MRTCSLTITYLQTLSIRSDIGVYDISDSSVRHSSNASDPFTSVASRQSQSPAGAIQRKVTL